MANRHIASSKTFKLTTRGLALLSITLLAACGSADAAEGIQDDSLPTFGTTGAEVPEGQDTDEGADSPRLTVPGASPGESDGTTPGGEAPPDPPAASLGPVPFRGINLAGAEFGNALPGQEGRDYVFPTTSEVDYFMSKGMNTFRLGFKWERMQHDAYGALDATYLSKLDVVVKYATSKGAHVVLNPHNFARYYGQTVGSSSVPSAVFADFWKKLAALYATNDHVMFNLVNEPHDLPTEQWVDAANAAIAAIRSAGATNLIVVPGNGWTGAHSWSSSGYGTPNSVAMLDVVDPADNMIFEVHQYLDPNSGGGSGQCVSTTIGSERMKGFVDWLRAHGKKGMLGEFAGGDNPTCNAAVTDMLTYVMAQDDVMVGWLWWAAGPGWGNYQFGLDPDGGKDKPQMSLLTPFL